MRSRTRKTVVFACALALTAAVAAEAVTVEIDRLVVSATAAISPRALPERGNAPVRLSSVTRVRTRDGSTPPALSKLSFKLDRNGTIDARGLPVCTEKKLAGTTPAAARKRCRGAIVGRGTARAVVTLPGQAAVKVSSPLTFFNAPPRRGRPALIAHAYETLPTKKALLVPLTVERIGGGRYGYRVEVELPPIAAGYGAATLAEATIGAVRKRGGRKVGYVNAHCAGGRLQVYGTASFADGSFFPATLVSPCRSAG